MAEVFGHTFPPCEDCGKDCMDEFSCDSQREFCLDCCGCPEHADQDFREGVGVFEEEASDTILTLTPLQVDTLRGHLGEILATDSNASIEEIYNQLTEEASV